MRSPRIVLLLFVLDQFILTTSIPAASKSTRNRCVESGTYLEVEEDFATAIITAPESGIMKTVGNKTCGFKVSGTIRKCGKAKKIEYVAVDVEENSDDEFCTFTDTEVTCVCSFYGCNSVTGVFYETILQSLTSTGTVKGVSASSKAPEVVQQNIIDCLLRHVEDVYRTSAHNATSQSASHYHQNPTDVELLRGKYSWLFPDETRKNELIAEGNRVPTTTMVPETTTLNTTTTQKPSAKASKDAGKVEDKEDSDNGVARMSLAINVFLALTVLALIGLIVAGVFYLKKRQKKKQAAKTKKTSVMTSTMDGGSEYNNPSTTPSADYFGVSKGRNTTSPSVQSPADSGVSAKSPSKG